MWEEETCYMTERFLIACEGGAPDWVIQTLLWGIVLVHFLWMMYLIHFKK